MLKTNMLFKWLIVLTTCYLAVSFLGNSLLNNIFRLPALIVIFFLLLKKIHRIKLGEFMSLMGIITIITINIFEDFKELNFDLFLSIISILLYLMLVIVSDGFRIDGNMKSFLNNNSLISSLLIILCAHSSLAHWTGTDYNDYLVLGYDNSNYAGIVIFLVYSALLVTNDSKNKFKKYITIIIALYLLFLISETGTRSATVAAIVIPIMALFIHKVKIRSWMIYAISLIPVLFVPFYMNLDKFGVDTTQEVMGKSMMTGRQFVYARFLDLLNDDLRIFWGNLLETRFLNAHNGPLAIYVSVGVLGFLCYYYIVVHKLKANIRYAITPNSKLAILVILACWIHSCGEAALFLGGFPIITYLFLFYIISASSKNIVR